jgi:hypothetical protein
LLSDTSLSPLEFLEAASEVVKVDVTPSAPRASTVGARESGVGDWREVQGWWGDSTHCSRQRRRLNSSLWTCGIWEVLVGGRWEMRILVSRGSTVTRRRTRVHWRRRPLVVGRGWGRLECSRREICLHRQCLWLVRQQDPLGIRWQGVLIILDTKRETLISPG